MRISRNQIAVLVTVGALVFGALGLVLLLNALRAVPANEATTDANTASPKQKPSTVATTLSVATVRDAAARKAVCMDGSPAIYYFRPGVDDGADRWVIWLEGGSACHDAASCEKARKDPDFSSLKAKPTKSIDGIFSPDPKLNPDFYNWNHVFLNNCNAGDWGGDDELVLDGRTYYFNGYNIVKAVTEDLSGLDSAEEILFTGSSGGGTGVGMNLDRVAGWYPNADVRGVIDSSYELDIEPYASVKAVDPSVGFHFINTHVDESCAAAYPTEPWNCNIKEYLYPYLTTRVFTYQDLVDAHKLADYGITDRTDPAQNAWVLAYEQNLIDHLAPLDGVFAPTIGQHAVLPTDYFFTTSINGHSFAEVLANWVLQRPGPTSLIASPK